MIKFIKRLLNKNYYYFVSYVFEKDNAIGKSRSQVTIDKKIESLNDIEQIEELIKVKNSFESCVIENYILMEKSYIEKENENV